MTSLKHNITSQFNRGDKASLRHEIIYVACSHLMGVSRITTSYWVEPSSIVHCLFPSVWLDVDSKYGIMYHVMVSKPKFTMGTMKVYLEVLGTSFCVGHELKVGPILWKDLLIAWHGSKTVDLALARGSPLHVGWHTYGVESFLSNCRFLETASSWLSLTILLSALIPFKETPIPLILELPRYLGALLDKDFLGP